MMKKWENMEYLTDTELECLIRETEQNELVPAPPDLQDLIVEVLELEMPRAQEKIVEFKRYRFRVLTTVAAAVLVVLLLPKVESMQLQGSEFNKPLTKSEYMTQSRYGSKEEALNDSGMLETMLGGINIFADNNRWNLFRE